MELFVPAERFDPASTPPPADAGDGDAVGVREQVRTTVTALSGTWEIWQRTQRLPRGVGTRLFSAAVALKAPYFRTVLPHVRELAPGRCVVSAPKWWGVQNHIGTFHAIAACNLAEVAMGMLAEATVPASHRWIPKAMTASYLAKTKGGLTATALLEPLPDFHAITSGVEVVVPVSLVDASGVETVHCDITIWVSRRKG